MSGEGSHVNLSLIYTCCTSEFEQIKLAKTLEFGYVQDPGSSEGRDSSVAQLLHFAYDVIIPGENTERAILPVFQLVYGVTSLSKYGSHWPPLRFQRRLRKIVCRNPVR